MKLGVVAVAAVSAATVWFWPQLSAQLAQHEWGRGVVGAVDEAASVVPSLRGVRTHEELTGRVVSIADGDTFTLLTADKQRVRVRLTEIDAPESGQPWGRRAKEALSGLVFSQTVRVVSAGLDRYGRTLGRVFVNGKDVNAEMVRSGAAHAYRQYLTDKSFLAMEEQARTARRGLWSLNAGQTQPPWKWRHESRGETGRGVSTVAQAAPGSGRASGQCGSKRYCREMASCEEARFYLNVCHVGTIDGDRDGIPCEAICGH